MSKKGRQKTGVDFGAFGVKKAEPPKAAEPIKSEADGQDKAKVENKKQEVKPVFVPKPDPNRAPPEPIWFVVVESCEYWSGGQLVKRAAGDMINARYVDVEEMQRLHHVRLVKKEEA